MADVKKQVVLPRKVRVKAQTATPASGTDKGVDIRNTEDLYWNQDIAQIRQLSGTAAALRALDKKDGIVSSAIFNMVAIANSGLEVRAYNSTDSVFSPEGVQLAKSLIAQMDTVYDYTLGFAKRKSMTAVIDSCIAETIFNGSCGLELVLNEQRLPDRLQPFAMDDITWVSDGSGGVYPKQKQAAGQVELNLPTVYVESLHQSLTNVYSSSMLEDPFNCIQV